MRHLSRSSLLSVAITDERAANWEPDADGHSDSDTFRDTDANPDCHSHTVTDTGR